MDRRAALKLTGGASLSALAATFAPAAFAAAGPLYKDARAPIPARVADLLKRMTLAEKVAQMRAVWSGKGDMLSGLAFDAAKASRNFPDGIGALARPSDKRGVPGVGEASGGSRDRWRTPAQTVEFINALQRWAMEGTRLGIPVLVHEESLHGYMATDATSFPQAIALAGTFDPDLMRRVNAKIAAEMRARGVFYTLSPVVDITRDPRWGRVEETYGEDPYLAGEMGVAAIEGLQGPGKFERLPKDRVFATLKHMTGHGQPESGTNAGPAVNGRRDLRENFFKPFREIVRRTSLGAVMPSYNEIDGIPSHANTWLLGEVLRGEWGFDGVISSDYNGVDQLASLHNVAADNADAARQALAAGVDSELPDGDAYATLVDQVAAGTVDQASIDRAVSRILTFKMRAGLFDNPYGDAALTARITGDAEGRALALEAAQKSMCLLKNDNAVLPLDPARMGGVAVIGPNADIVRFGGYSSVPKQSVTILEGLRAAAPAADIVSAQGVFITTSDDRSVDEIELFPRERNLKLIEQAVEVARGSDTIILAIGDTEQTSREGFAVNHLGDRDNIDIVGEQNALVDAMAALGKPLVVCAVNGRPPSWPDVVDKADAVLECWYSGQESGTAIAHALLGLINPGAKMPITVARNVGQLPFFYNHKPSARRGYLFADKAPLFPFGHGLSYTTFAVSAPRPSKTSFGLDEPVECTVEVTNTGTRQGDEVVQLYVTQSDLSVTQSVLELKGFERIALAAGETKTVSFSIPPRELAIWNRDMEETNEPGPLALSAGSSSTGLSTVQVEITA